jgi:DNA polymerase III sliding clamp (beta) subunit (PCNA family)
MSLLDSLKFVKGGVARRDAVPILNHYRIKDGRISGFNGNISLSAPIALALDCQPKAAPFTKAVEICESMDAVPALSMTKGGKLTVAAGSFRVHIECIDEAFPDEGPEGTELECPPELIQCVKVLAPLIGEDASRPWARGILIREGSAFATNNVAIAQYWLGTLLPFDINIPEECIRELIRIKQQPSKIVASERSVSFVFEDGRYIKSQLLSTQWPNVAPVLDRASDPKPIPRDFFEILARLSSYTDAAKRVFFDGTGITTHLHEGEGARQDCRYEDGSELPKAVFNIDLLRALDGLVAECDFSLYPTPCLFYGAPNAAGHAVFRGAIVGMKPTDIAPV